MILDLDIVNVTLFNICILLYLKRMLNLFQSAVKFLVNQLDTVVA